MYTKLNGKGVKNNKSGAVIIYVIFLLAISLVLATIIFDSVVLLKNEREINSIESELFLNINEQFKLVLNKSDYFNNNGSGFIDNISCPKNLTMSGTVNSSLVSTYATFTGGQVLCSGDYLGDELQIFFTSDFTDLSGAIYKGNSVVLNVGIQINTFADGDSTIIDVTASNYTSADNIDDNMNSDNFLSSSIDNSYYPNGFQDDDVLSRLEYTGYIKKGENKNIFWSNTKINNFIDDNANNYDLINVRMGNVGTGVLFLDINTGSTLRILKINKNEYDVNNEIKVLNSLSGSLLSGSGYIQNNAGLLSLNSIKTGNEYYFDFIDNDYALFLENSGTGILKYNIKGETDSGTGIYIVPFNDGSDNELSFLGNDIIYNNGRYIGKTQELKKYLKFGNGAGASYVIQSYTSGPSTGKRWSDGTYSETCYKYRYPDSGSSYKYLGDAGDGYYWLSPGITAFLAYCDMTGGGWTKAIINESTEFRIVGIDTFSLLKSFTYDLTQAEITSIKSYSVDFKQYFKKRCYRSIVFDGGSPNQNKWRTFGSTLLNGSYFPNYNICDSHNLDSILPVTWYESSGYSYTGSFLPITEIWGGDTGAESPPGTPSEDSYYQFGDFYMR